MAFCTNCGANQQDTANFCSKCGNSMNTAPVPVPEVITAPPAPVMPKQPAPSVMPPAPVMPEQHSEPPAPPPTPHTEPPAPPPAPPVSQPAPQPAPPAPPPAPPAPPPAPPVTPQVPPVPQPTPVQPPHHAPLTAYIQPPGGHRNAAGTAITAPRQGSFSDNIRTYAGSPLFLIGIILFTIGSIALQYPFSGVWSFILLLLAALPITGFWMMFVASKSDRLPSKVSGSLAFFSTGLIINLVLACIAVLILFFTAILVFIGADFFSFIGSGFDVFYDIYDSSAQTAFASPAAGRLYTAGFVIIGIAVVSLIITIFYYRSVLKIISAVRRGIKIGNINALPCIKTFTVLTAAGIFFLITGSAAIIGIYSDLPGFYDAMVSNVLPDTLFYGLYFSVFDYLPQSSADIYMYISPISVIITNIGVLLCLITLIQFNKKIKPAAGLF